MVLKIWLLKSLPLLKNADIRIWLAVLYSSHILFQEVHSSGMDVGEYYFT